MEWEADHSGGCNGQEPIIMTIKARGRGGFEQGGSSGSTENQPHSRYTLKYSQQGLLMDWMLEEGDCGPFQGFWPEQVEGLTEMGRHQERQVWEGRSKTQIGT